jgi:hypothetical protein
MSEYWSITVEEIVSVLGISIGNDVLKELTDNIESAAEMKSEYCGEHFIPDPLVEENKELLAKLEKEISKVVCKKCWGEGSVKTFGLSHGSISQCLECRGNGKVLP